MSAILAASGCGSDLAPPSAAPGSAESPGYCRELVVIPSELEAAINNAAFGGASSGDKETLLEGAAQLRATAQDASVPADLSTALANTAASLEKMSAGEPLSEEDISSFGTLGEVVDQVCPGT